MLAAKQLLRTTGCLSGLAWYHERSHKLAPVTRSVTPPMDCTILETARQPP